MIQQPQFYQQPYNQYATPPQASAVNIQIFEPKAYGGAPTPIAPVQQPVYGNTIYGYPQTSIYNPGQNMIYPGYQPFTIPTTYTPPVYTPPIQQPTVQQPAIQQPVSEPTKMPEPVLEKPETKPEIVQAPNVEQNQNVTIPPVPTPNKEAEAVAPVDTVKIQEPDAQPIQKVDVTALVNQLNGADLDAQTDAITKIAQMSQAGGDIAPQVVDEQIMQGLLNVIKKNTVKLQGPTQQQITIAHKVANGEQLTPSEQAIYQQSSPREIAEKNKVFAMFTLAMLQKNLRDEVDTYNSDVQKTINNEPTSTGKPVQGAQLPPLDITPFVNEITSAIEQSEIPAVKVAGLQALSYVATKPEDKQILENAIGKFVYDPDTNISTAAKEALAKVGAQQA